MKQCCDIIHFGSTEKRVILDSNSSLIELSGSCSLILEPLVCWFGSLLKPKILILLAAIFEANNCDQGSILLWFREQFEFSHDLWAWLIQQLLHSN